MALTTYRVWYGCRVDGTAYKRGTVVQLESTNASVIYNVGKGRLRPTTGEIADGSVVPDDIVAGTNGQALITRTGSTAWSAIAKTDVTGTAITAADSGTVTSAMIANGTIVNDDINASAAIDTTKIANFDAKAYSAAQTQNPQTDSYELVIGDAGKLVEMGKGTAQTLTVPTNTVAFPVGTRIDIVQTGAGQVTVAGADGVTVNATPGLKFRAQWSAGTLIKRATNTWVLIGDLSA